VLDEAVAAAEEVAVAVGEDEAAVAAGPLEAVVADRAALGEGADRAALGAADPVGVLLLQAAAVYGRDLPLVTADEHGLALTGIEPISATFLAIFTRTLGIILDLLGAGEVGVAPGA